MTDFQGIKAIAALHKRGFLVCNWLFLNSISEPTPFCSAHEQLSLLVFEEWKEILITKRLLVP